MKALKMLVLLAVCLLMTGLAVAKLNQYGVSDTDKVTFTEPMKVGVTVLPAGDYSVTHTMEGENHIMVFKQLNVKNPAEAKAKCTLVKLASKADTSSQLYTHDAANAHVLQELTFKGETAKHVF
jgi:hypothetical protein